MAAHDPITNEEFSSTLSLSLSLSLGNIELLLKGIQTQTYEGNITAVDFNAGNGRTCGWLRSVADSALGDAITQSLTFSYYYCSAVFIMYYCASLSLSLSLPLFLDEKALSQFRFSRSLSFPFLLFSQFSLRLRDYVDFIRRMDDD